MEKEIADILLRGELPILPPESFVTNQQSDTKVEKEPGDALEKDKIKKLKRKQYFRRQNLKRQKEKSKLVAATPSFDFVCINYMFLCIECVHIFIFFQEGS